MIANNYDSVKAYIGKKIGIVTRDELTKHLCLEINTITQIEFNDRDYLIFIDDKAGEFYGDWSTENKKLNYYCLDDVELYELNEIDELKCQLL